MSLGKTSTLSAILLSVAFTATNGFCRDEKFENSFRENASIKADLPASVHRFYSDGQASLRCGLISGEGTQSPNVQEQVNVIRTTLTRFPAGARIVSDLKTSGTALCFEGSHIGDANVTETREAEYRRDQNLMRFSQVDLPKIIHEWKHKNDNLDFNGFTLKPRDAAILYRVSECGAYAFEAMTVFDAAQAGVILSSGVDPTHIENNSQKLYAQSILSGQGQEKAWRNTFDECFNYSLKHVYSAAIINAYSKAVDYPPLRNNPNFGRATISNEELMRVALPPGWSIEVFDRTGGNKILSNNRYSDFLSFQELQLRDLQIKIDNP